MSSKIATSNSASFGSTSSKLGLKDTWTSFLLWDIDREFQNAHEAYKRWATKNQRRRSTWEYFAGSNKDDPLGRSLRLGNHVHKSIKDGQRRYGQTFDKGDAICHTILIAQLLRLQREVCTPLKDAVDSRYLCPITHCDIVRAARGVRRACLDAIEDQIARLSTQKIEPFLPPPRFSVAFCPFALQLRKDQRIGYESKLQIRKVYPQDCYDDRENCPYCKAIVSVTAHSGLPQYRRILFESHTLQQDQKLEERASFACNSCYKIFDDSYAFLEHIFQKHLGSENSCLKRHSPHLSVDVSPMENDTKFVERCLRNCLKREMMTPKAIGKSSEMLKFEKGTVLVDREPHLRRMMFE